MGCHGKMYLHIARIRFFLRIKSYVFIGSYATREKLSWGGGSKVCHIRSQGNPHGQTWWVG